MSKKLWFISEDNDLLGVFDDRSIVSEEIFFLRKKHPDSLFKIYSLSLSEIQNHPDEYELAVFEGYIHWEKSSLVS